MFHLQQEFTQPVMAEPKEPWRKGCSHVCFADPENTYLTSPWQGNGAKKKGQAHLLPQLQA